MVNLADPGNDDDQNMSTYLLCAASALKKIKENVHVKEDIHDKY